MLRPVLIFLAIPLLEIAVFVIVGQHIGALPTVALVILTGIGGAVLLRIQGFGALAKIRYQLEAGGDPGREIVHGAMIMVAGFLLVIPGFVTDALGLLLFIPNVRDAAWSFLKSRMAMVDMFTRRSDTHGGRARGGKTIDLDQDEYFKKRDGKDPASPWRKLEDDNS
ncbi:membrane protein FxsA [Mesorhizobium sp. NBSH29]|uniref:FxsA family protein n=1 Tax=Mesorhizobium sp. NBSH29 TaxID=2654249 RepID=UPI00189686FF|nr:FxsA family protein [Mesorhizobium sp. NBSH29]QPC86079.1 membrane protein FxsA [Mesorhizobium sp. NBSH29]